MKRSNVTAIASTHSPRRFAMTPVGPGKTFASKVNKGILILVGWTVFGLLMSIPHVLRGFDWPNVINKLIEYWAWALLTPAILYVDRRLARFDSRPLLHTGIFLLFSAPFSLVHVYLTAVLLYPDTQIWWNPLRSPEFVTYYFLGGWLVSFAIIGALEALRYYRSFLAGRMALERVEKRLLESHLNTLRMQLEPHFLFNALNAISSEVISNPELARDMIEDLGALLRLSLDYKDNQEIPLSQEMVLLEHYLAIQRVRFGDRIRTETHVETEALNALVPCMLLQPIVENAIRHGLGKRAAGGCVAISAVRKSDILEVRVSDDGVGLPHGCDIENAKGLGVRATRERLTGLYPKIATPFEINNGTVAGVDVIMRIPLRFAGADGHGTAI
jgi:two-component system, LytTR family, sensor kinase